MLKVLFLIQSLNVGGAERQLMILASGLQKKGHNVKVVVFYKGGRLEEQAKSMGIEIADLHRHGRGDLLPFFFRLITFIKKEKPDILHSYMQVANIWAALLKAALPRTKIVWGVRASHVNLDHYGFQSKITYKIETLLSKIPNWIICNSQAGMLNAAQKGYPPQKMSVIPNGIDTDHFFPNEQERLSMRKSWGVNPSETLIGMAGRIDPMKDYPNFLQSAALLLRERSDLRFVCVGGGADQYVRQYQDLAHTLKLENSLLWAGEQKNMRAVYNALDILVLSSVGESFPNVVAEAMSCGVPCIVTDVGDVTIIIGDTGKCVPPKDPTALKNGILSMLQKISKNPALKDQARQHILENFKVDLLADRTSKLFEELVKTK